MPSFRLLALAVVASVALRFGVQGGVESGTSSAKAAPASEHLHLATGTVASVVTSHEIVSGLPQRSGRWLGAIGWNFVPVHLSTMPDGKVLSWAGMGGVSRGKRSALVWDPVTGEFTPTDSTIDIYCSGHTFLPDGRLLEVGGHLNDQYGIRDVTIFDPDSHTWVESEGMRVGRWYPTVTALPSGEVLATAGLVSPNSRNTIPEVRANDGSWRRLTAASFPLPVYPWMHVAPDGRVLVAGPEQDARLLSTDDAGSWTDLPDPHFGNRFAGSSVLYESGKVLIAGGGQTTNTAEIIDLNEPAPTWKYTGPMAFSRRHLNLTVLADGTVLASGGTSQPTGDDSNAILEAEIWNPDSGIWTTVARMSVPRLYHSAAVLLPDGQVMMAGGGLLRGYQDRPSAEIFSPPYLFDEAGLPVERPVIGTAPRSVGYGDPFRVATPQAANIRKVSWVRLSSTTHSFNQNQRYMSLEFTANSSGLNVAIPADRNLNPPGHYMLFILDHKGVPSVSRIIQLR